MEIKIIKDKFFWENFLTGKEKTFLQSWNWAKFQESLGEKIFRIGVFKNGKLIGLALTIKIEAKRGKFFLIPHGPIVEKEENKKETLEALIDFLKEKAKKEKTDFIRIAPIFPDTEENKKILFSLNFRDAPIHIHPEITWTIDISKPEEEIFANFRKVHRNLIRRAIKEGVKIEESNNRKGVEIFYKLYLQTAKRQKFVPFSKEYLEKEFEAFTEDNQISIFLAKHKEEILASAFVIFYDRVAYYHQGASIHSKIPAPYLLQWEIIKEAKRRGCLTYNMWGVAPIKIEEYQRIITKNQKIDPYKIFKKSHPWFGLSLFKTGFGGKAKFYLKTKDLVLSKKYWLNWIVEWARKVKRGYY